MMLLAGNGLITTLQLRSILILTELGAECDIRRLMKTCMFCGCELHVTMRCGDNVPFLKQRSSGVIVLVRGIFSLWV